ncbi:MAG TPA: MlaE family lipid ABC transporter permease subunit [Rhizomicrobium sp.]|jgi:phospholipid/cholesterol/gamma-HCH transport system permease protein
MVSLSDARPVEERAWFKTERRDDVLRFVVGGDWTLPEAPRLDPKLRALDLAKVGEAEIDGKELDKLDSAGAWLLLRTKRTLEDGGAKVRSFVIPESYGPLFGTLEREHKAPPTTETSRPPFLYRVGRGFMHAVNQGYEMLGYLGRVTVETVQTIGPQKQLRWKAFIHQVEETGINALPIVGLLSFLIGVVLAYQGADQLKRFGAEIFTINLLGVSILREVGGLITAIIIAGRSGSAFTAQIGTMRVNEEIDAMQTIGLNTVDVLVLPRIAGLVIALPFLTFFSDVMAMVGGAVMCYFDLGITFPTFLRQLQAAITVDTFVVGMVKAPVFAFVIGLVGCFEGLKVERNAESVGRLTTRSVVEAIFLIIVLDAGFSIMFSILGI